MTTLPSVCLLDDARRWFEASSRICGYVPDGVVRTKRVGHSPVFLTLFSPPAGNQITETYTQLMDRFGS